MNNKNTKTMNVKRNILIIVLLFTIMVVLPGIISSLATKVNAYSFKSISGKKTWKTTEDCAELYEFLSNIKADGGTLPSYRSKMTTNKLEIGTSFGRTSGSKDSFNRAGCILDSGDETTAVNMICSESNNSTIDSTSGNEINQILYITPSKIEFYKMNSKGDTKHEIISASNGYKNGKLDGYEYQKLLAVAYSSQNGCDKSKYSNYDTAVHFAEYISKTPTWKNNINKRLNNKIEFWDVDWSSYDSNLEYSNYGASVSEYQYSGIFVFFSIGKGTGQGRVMYRVVREASDPDINVKIKKVNQNNNLLSGAEIYVNANYSGSNVKSMFMGEDKVKNNNTSLSNGSSWDLTIVPEDTSKPVKLKVTETMAPLGYTGVSGTYEITINYDRAGKITGITGGSGNVTVSGQNTDTAQVTIKNQKISASGFKKVDFNGNEVKDATFDVYLEHLNGLSIEDQKFNFATYSNSYRKTRDRIPPYYKYNEETKEYDEVYNYGPWYYFYKTDSIKGHALEMGCVSSCSRNKDNGSLSISNTTTGNNWSYMIVKGIKSGQISNIEAWGDPWNGRMIISETSVPDGYEKLTQPLSLIYSNGKWCAHSTNTLSSEYYSINSSTSEIKIKNDYKLNNLNFAKYAYNPSTGATGDAISGTKFNVTLKNVKHIDGYSYSGETLYLQNVDLGALNFRNVVFDDTPIEVTLEEVSAPVGYKRITGTIKLTIARNGDNYTITNNSTGVNETKEFGNSDIIRNGHTITVNIKNIPVMNLGGFVWLDGQENSKKYDENTDYNKKYDSNEGMENIKVELYKGDPEKGGTIVSNNEYGKALMTKTASNGSTLKYDLCKEINGSYETTATLSKGQYIFANIEKGTNYYVQFTYDGINYQTLPVTDLYTNNDQSKASEIDRTTFNNRFKTITNNTATSTDSTDKKTTTLGYTGGTAGDYKTSTLITENDDHSVKDEFAMKAKAGNYLNKAEDWTSTWKDDGTINTGNYALDVNCGLYKKELDLQLGTELVGAKLTINGKETDYIYDDVIIGEAKPEKYNLYLFTSDYTFRINSYKNNPIGSDNGSELDTGDLDLNNLNLEVKVTYKIKLENATPWNSSRVDKIAYYYDKEFINPEIKTGNYTIQKDPDVENKIILKHKDDSDDSYDLNRDSSTQEIEIEFTVAKDSSKDNSIILKDDCTNVAEIIKYSTKEGGLIDRDSAPDNANVRFNNNGTPTLEKLEDDTWQSNALNIQIKQEQNRTISGTVWDDGKFNEADGIFNGETPVNDVIVQLIEIVEVEEGNVKGKDVSGIIADGTYEYIWQQTKTGSGEVEYTPLDGTTPDEKPKYNVTAEDGKYCFNQYIIPGNYIIRFIYGDGKTYDLTDNVKTYNGQDYKSTIDEYYNAPWYNTAGYSADENRNYPSVARDNEARRLEVMAYSTMIDANIGEALDTLGKTDLTETEKNVLNKYYDSLDKGNAEVKYALSVLKKFTEQTDITFDNISEENKYKLIKYYVSLKTWMCAETSKINVMVDKDTEKGVGKEENTTFNGNNDKESVVFDNVNFGLALRPETNLVLEKHITGLKITPSGTGVQPIVDARANISDIIKGSTKGTVDAGTVEASGVTQGLATIKATRENRGFWQVATDIEELAQGAQLEVEYTYVIRNDGEEDYLSKILVNAYEGYKTNEDGTRSNEALGKSYQEYLEWASSKRKTSTKGKTNTYGTYLGQWYYTKNKAESDEKVTSRIETLEEALNNDLTFDSETSGTDFKVSNTNVEKTVYDTDGNTKSEKINTVIVNDKPTSFLIPKIGDTYTEETADYSKTITLRTILSATSGGELGANLPSHIAEVVKYSNAAGRRDMQAEPENLSYVHSDDTRMTLVENNERDEFWGETIIITKPTGEDKLTPLQIAIITISSIAVIGVGIVLIKKFVLKK